MLFTEANMDVVYDFYGNRSTFEYEFEYEYEYVAVFMDMLSVLRNLVVPALQLSPSVREGKTPQADAI